MTSSGMCSAHVPGRQVTALKDGFQHCAGHLLAGDIGYHDWEASARRT